MFGGGLATPICTHTNHWVIIRKGHIIAYLIHSLNETNKIWYTRTYSIKLEEIAKFTLFFFRITLHFLSNLKQNLDWRKFFEILKMCPIVIILKDEKNTDSWTFAYESFRKEILVIIQQQLTKNGWVTVNHMAVPIVMFDNIQCFRFEKALLKGSKHTLDFVTNYIREFIFDPMVLEENVRKILHDYYIKDIPLYEKLEGYWRGLEMIENLVKLPIIESPDVSIHENYESSAPVTPATKKATVLEPDSTTLVTPSVSFCYAPKKRKISSKNPLLQWRTQFDKKQLSHFHFILHLLLLTFAD